MIDDDILFRFAGIQRLYGEKAFSKILNGRVLLIGLGGVGSWTAEALARTGVGHITLMDFDDICVSNTNRQMHATQDNIGKMKTQAIQQRLLSINPKLDVNIIEEAFTPENAAEILSDQYDVVIDAVDRFQAKFELAMQCKRLKIPLILSGSAGGRKDPSKITIADLSQTREDKLLSHVRKWLRQKAGFPRQGKMNLKCVYSTEKAIYPSADGCATTDKPQAFKKPLDCATGFGTITHVTGSFGFQLAHIALETIVR